MTSPQVIPASDIHLLQSLRSQLAKAKNQASLLEAQEKALEKTIVGRLKAGFLGDPLAPPILLVKEPRRNISWKEAYTKALGEEAALRVTTMTEPTIYENILVGAEIKVKSGLMAILVGKKEEQVRAIAAVLQAGGTKELILHEVRLHAHKSGWKTSELAMTLVDVSQDVDAVLKSQETPASTETVVQNAIKAGRAARQAAPRKGRRKKK